MVVNVASAGTLVAGLTAAVVLAGAAALEATSNADHIHAHAASAERLALSACEGGRALCGDRAGGAPPEIAESEATDIDVAGCMGGRRVCGDRPADPAAASIGTAPADGGADEGEHPRALRR